MVGGAHHRTVGGVGFFRPVSECARLGRIQAGRPDRGADSVPLYNSQAVKSQERHSSRSGILPELFTVEGI
jgi:hypothetical protein